MTHPAPFRDATGVLDTLLDAKAYQALVEAEAG